MALEDTFYTHLCTEKTLQSNDKGFFLDFVAEVVKTVGEKWINEKFGKLNSDQERIQMLFQHKPASKVIESILVNVQEIYRKKSSEISQARRLDAEKALQDNELKKSLVLFSQSILRAEETGKSKVDNGLSLALGLFGRSKLLLKLGKYDLALTDLQLSLKENLPNDLKSETYGNMAICYKHINELKKSELSFLLSEKFASNKEKTQNFRETLDKIDNSLILKNNKTDYSPQITGKKHKKFPNASNKLQVKNSSSQGRYIVANNKIKTGETLVVEEPYVACLATEEMGTHCINCFKRLEAPIWCPTCSNVAFCCTKCREEALSTYHQYECKISDLLLGSGISILSHLALRAVTQRNLKNTLENYSNKDSNHVYSLCRNSTKRKPMDFFQRSLMAIFLLRCLKKVGYFNFKNKQVVENGNELKVAEILLFYLQIVQFNAHEIYEKRFSKNHYFKGSKICNIGVGLYPTVALFNHECYPSVTRHFVGKTIVISSIKPINKDQIVAENYGPIFTRKPLLERKRILLSRYWFDCECIACLQNWPLLKNEHDFSLRIRCPNPSCINIFTFPMPQENVMCLGCNQTVNLNTNILKLKWCEEQYQRAFDEMDNLKIENAISLLKNALDEFDQISVSPHRQTHLAEETLRACYAHLGNIYDVNS